VFFVFGINRGIKREKTRITSSMRNQLTVQERNSLYMARKRVRTEWLKGREFVN
jgi:hypothetical protein